MSVTRERFVPLLRRLTAVAATTGLVAALLSGVGAGQAAAESCHPFPDVTSSNPACANIAWLKGQDITKPADGLYHPTSAVNRGSMAAFLFRLTHPGKASPTCHSRPFPDVPTSNVFCGYIQWAKTHHIAFGYPDGTYGPAKEVTRGAMAAYLHRIVTGKAAPRCTSRPFTDVPVDSTFCGVIAWMKTTGITYGVGGGKYGTTLPVTRQAMASFLHRSADRATATPVVTITVPHKAFVGHTVTISTTGTRLPDGVKKFVLNFGDGSQARTATSLLSSVTHTFTKTGTFTVTLTITDNAGHTHSTTRQVVLIRSTTAKGTGALTPKATSAPGTTLPKAGLLPTSVNLTRWAVPVGDQGQVDSCNTWAVDYGLMGWYAKRAGWPVTTFAPMYTYAQLAKGNPLKGTYTSDVLAMAVNQGVDSAADYPGWKNDYTTQPTSAQRANADKYRIASWREVINTKSSPAQKEAVIKTYLAAGYPLVFGMAEYASFNNYQGGYYKDTSTTYRGGHEMLILGYDSKGILVENSWGTSTFGTKTVAFGKRMPGYVWISWTTAEKDITDADIISGLIDRSQDTTRPTATAPVQRFVSSTSVNRYGVPVQISWSGSDNSGEVASYDLWARTNGQPWTQQALSPANATSATFSLQPGSTYQFAVRSRDAAGNVSDWKYGPSFRVANFQENSSYVHYSGTGWTYTAWAPAQGGQVAVSGVAGDRVSFTFTGRNVAWVSTQGSVQGQARVYMDGEYRFTVDLYGATVQNQKLAVVANFATAGTHTLSIQVVGTAGRPNVSVDSFVLLG